jgi:hypothetical protein
VDKTGKRHTITLHSFRRHVYTTIGSLGLNQFAEYYIGHIHSSYWDRSEADKLKDFAKVEPYLTFMDFNQLEADTQDVKTKLGALEYENIQLKGQIANMQKKFDEMKPFLEEAQKNSRTAPEVAQLMLKVVEDNKRMQQEIDRLKKARAKLRRKENRFLTPELTAPRPLTDRCVW